jgi:hypothetical protein
MRTNWALLTVVLCYAAAPAATCDPRDQLSALNEPEWTLAEPGPTTSHAPFAPSTVSQQASGITDATIVLTRVPKLPSTSTAPEPELQSRLLMVCLGFFLTVAGAAMLLRPRR